MPLVQTDLFSPEHSTGIAQVSKPLHLDSPEYLGFANNPSRTVESIGVYGAQILACIDYANEAAATGGKVSGRTESAWRQSAYKSARRQERYLAELEPAPRSMINPYLRLEFEEFEDAPSTPADDPVARLSKLDTDDFIDFLRRHHEKMAEATNAFETDAPAERERFLERFEKGIKLGILPDCLDDARKKVALTKLHLSDAFHSAMASGEYAGYFDAKDSTALIVASTNPDFQHSVFTHEMLHAVSGRTATQVSDPTFDMPVSWRSRAYWQSKLKGQPVPLRPPFILTVEHNRIGFSRPLTNQQRWLNEAVTEHLTQQFEDDFTAPINAKGILSLLENDKYKIYEQERRLLAAVLTCGKKEIPLKAFIDAYFEDYDPLRPAGSRVPATMELHRLITEAYGPGFLRILDAFLDEKSRSDKYDRARRLQKAEQLLRMDPDLLRTSKPSNGKDLTPQEFIDLETQLSFLVNEKIITIFPSLESGESGGEEYLYLGKYAIDDKGSTLQVRMLANSTYLDFNNVSVTIHDVGRKIFTEYSFTTNAAGTPEWDSKLSGPERAPDYDPVAVHHFDMSHIADSVEELMQLAVLPIQQKKEFILLSEVIAGLLAEHPEPGAIREQHDFFTRKMLATQK